MVEQRKNSIPYKYSMKKLILAILATVSLSAFADTCDHLYPNQIKHVIKGTVQLCNSWYVVRYDEVNRRPLMVSEILDPKTTVTVRKDAFKKDDRVKHPVRPSELDRTGFDKGHLVPADDASDQQEMKETFLMTNAVPQSPKLNRGQWRKLETYVRSKARGQAVYVVTGALYDETALVSLHTVPVPYAMYKVGYFKSGTEYWYAKNEDGAKAVRVQKAQIENEAGYRLP